MSDISRINSNRKFMECLYNMIRCESDISEKLKLIRVATYFAYIVYTGYYTLAELESGLIDISLKLPFSESHDNYETDTVLHVMTYCFDVGGHTRIVENWINFDNSKKHSVYIVDPSVDIPTRMTDAVSNSGGAIIKLDSLDYIKNALFLYESALNFEKIILHIDPDDIVPTLAFGHKNWKRSVFFVNHAEHLPWVGASISDIVLEMNQEASLFSKKKRGIKNSYLLSIPIKQADVSLELTNPNTRRDLGIPASAFVCVSMATDYKYSSFEPYNFFMFCEKLMDATEDIYFVIIGAENEKKKWRDLVSKTKGRVIPLKPTADSNKIADIFRSSNLYIDSFFMNSFTSSLEALSYNLPVVILKSGNTTMDALNHCCVSSVDQLMNEIKKYAAGEIDAKKVVCESKEKLKQFNYKDAWLENMHNIVYRQDMMTHTVDTDFSDIETKITETEILWDKFMNERELWITHPICISLLSTISEMNFKKMVANCLKIYIMLEPSILFDMLFILKINSKIRNFINNNNRIYFYGTGVIAREVFKYFNIPQKVIGFIVSDGHFKKSEFMGEMVFNISEVISDINNCGIVLAMDRKNQKMVLSNLKKVGFKNILKI